MSDIITVKCGYKGYLPVLATEDQRTICSTAMYKLRQELLDLGHKVTQIQNNRMTLIYKRKHHYDLSVMLEEETDKPIYYIRLEDEDSVEYIEFQTAEDLFRE